MVLPMKLSMSAQDNIKMLKTASTQFFDGNKVMQDLMVTQAILESGIFNGRPSNLALHANNLFGIKGKGTAGSVSMLTTEYIKGKPKKMMQDFAKNKTVEDSLAQHERLLNKPRYARVKEAQTFAEAARAIHKAGYATDPAYPRKLVQVYESWVKNK